MNEHYREILIRLPALFGGHMALTFCAMACGTAISIPAGIYAAGARSNAREAIVGFAGVLQTIPSIALLALMMALVGDIGFKPALIALVLYSIFPMIKNTVTGIRGVDEDVVDAARAVGMTERQVLGKVLLPLAAPTILAGVRISTILVVGTATLATPIGGSSLGDFIFKGIATRNYPMILTGCIASAGLAIVLDQLLRLVEKGLAIRNTRLLAGSIIGILLVVAVGLGGLFVEFAPAAAPAVENATPVALNTEPEALHLVVVGSKPYTEQYILAQLISTRLRNSGFEVDDRPNLGSTVLFDAMADNSVDCYVDYTGTLWSSVMKKGGNPGADRLYIELSAYLLEQDDILTLGRLGFENSYGFAMKRERANEMGIHSLSDLAGRAKGLTLGSDYEFFGRAEWKNVRTVYGLEAMKLDTMDPSLMYQAINQKKVDVVTAYTSDGRIPAYDLTLLSDNKRVLPPYDAVLLISPRASRDANLLNALRPLVGKLTLERMQEANKQVDQDGKTTTEVAGALYTEIFR